MFEFFKKKKKVEEVNLFEKPKNKLIRCHVVGTEYREQNIKSLFKAMKESDVLIKNDDYSLSKKDFVDEYIYGEKVYEFDSVDLDARLTQVSIEKDSTAIQIEASCDGEKWFMIGYVPKKEKKNIAPLLDHQKFMIEWNGFKYKKVVNDDVEIGEEHRFEIIYWVNADESN